MRSIKPLSSSLRMSATVDDLLQLDLADAGITGLHQALYIAHSLEGGMGSLFEAAARQ